MGVLLTLGLALAGLDMLLALAVGAVYWRNHKAFRSPFTWGLVLFALFLIVHNGVVIYHVLSMMGAEPPGGEWFFLAENAVQAAALTALLWATYR